MSAFAFSLLCIQACLLQNAFGALGPMGYGLAGPYGTGFPGAYGCGYGFAGIGPYGAGIAGLAGPYGFPGPFTGIGLADAIEPFGYSGYAAYGGAGVGNCAIAGELPVGGATNVAGQVPIIGAVEYGGVVPAIGTVSIAGKCACGCGGSYY